MFINIYDDGFTIVDRYNPLKRFIVRRYKCGHYAVRQTVAGQPTSKAVRMLESQVYKLGGIDNG